MIDKEKTKEKFEHVVDDLSKGSRKSVIAHCDYCNQEMVKEYKAIMNSRKKLDKDACWDCRFKKREEIELKLHGVKNPFQRKSTKDKIKQTNQEKYGCDWVTQSDNFKEKTKKTNLERYGSEQYGASEDCKNKRESTMEERYGAKNPSNVKEFQDKRKQTNIKKFGVESSLLSSEVRDKINKTVKEKYGVDNLFQNEDIKEKIKRTNKKKYGVEYTMQNKEIREKTKETNKEKYGVENPAQSEEVKEKIRKTNLEKYGVESVFSSKEIRAKIISTNMKKYGQSYPPTQQTSKPELEIKEWLLNQGFEFDNNYDILNGQELDLYNKELKLAIEYCGLFWHCENSMTPRNKDYHYTKFLNCKNKGIDLVTIFSDEWETRAEQIKGFLKSKINKNSHHIYARNCNIKKLNSEDSIEFINKYHIQELKRIPIISYGIYLQEELLGVISLNYHHRDKNKIVLDRLVFKYDYTILGGSSKLFTKCIEFAKQNSYNSIITWSDNRWSNGNVYYKIGFNLDSTLEPDYSYVNLTKSINKRYSKQSMKKSKIGCPKDITEKDFLIKKGFSRIWDCGKQRFIYEL